MKPVILCQALYDQARLYDLALCSYRNVQSDGDVIADCVRRFSRIPVAHVLELGCGPAPNAADLAHRGYHYAGLDINPAMVAYGRQKYATLADRVRFVEGDMLAIPPDLSADLILLLAGSFFPLTNEDIRSHLVSVARVLRKGGLYLLDTCIECPGGDEDAPRRFRHTAEGIEFDITMAWRWVDCAAQVIDATITVEAREQERTLHLESADRFRRLFPQELRLWLELVPGFEFVGWWKDWDLATPLDGQVEAGRSLVAIRRV